MRRLMSVDDAVRALGIQSRLPMVGYVVSEGWSRSHEALVQSFVRAARRADEILATSDAEWERIAPRTGARDAAELRQLRDAFRAGIPAHWGDAERRDAARLYDKLAAIGGESLVGPSRSLAPGTFLDGVRY
jgi:NitT/TauT family transport system substrate-binding protein